MSTRRTPWLLATYLILLSLIWALNGGYFLAQRASATMVFSAGQDVLTEARKGLAWLQENDPGHLTEHRVAYHHLQQLLLAHKAEYDRGTPWGDIAVSVLALLTALAYCLTGILLFMRRVPAAWKVVRAGMSGVALHYVLITVDFCRTMVPLNTAVNRLLDVFGIKHGGGGVTGPVLWIVAGFLAATVVFYVVVPVWRMRVLLGGGEGDEC